MDQMATDIGSRLRQARQMRGLTIRDIASVTKISAVALDAIERNDFARLPGGLFGRAYVRAFAVEVGLNADELTREYRERVEADVSACPLLVHEADGGDRARALRWLVAVVIIGGGLLIGGLLISNTAHSPQEPWAGNAGRLLGVDVEVLTAEPATHAGTLCLCPPCGTLTVFGGMARCAQTPDHEPQ